MVTKGPNSLIPYEPPVRKLHRVTEIMWDLGLVPFVHGVVCWGWFLLGPRLKSAGLQVLGAVKGLGWVLPPPSNSLY